MVSPDVELLLIGCCRFNSMYRRGAIWCMRYQRGLCNLDAPHDTVVDFLSETVAGGGSSSSLQAWPVSCGSYACQNQMIFIRWGKQVKSGSCPGSRNKIRRSSSLFFAKVLTWCNPISIVNSFAAFVLEKKYFPWFPRPPTNLNLSSHYLSTETFHESWIFKEFWKSFCFQAKSFHQWRSPYKFEQFWKNIFPGFPIIRKFLILITLPFHRNLPRKSDFKNFESAFAQTPSPVANGEVHTSWNKIGALVLEKLYFHCFPRRPETPINLSSHCFPIKTVRESRILKEFWKCFCSGTQHIHQWRGSYKMEQYWSFGSGEILFSLLSPYSK